MEPVCVADVKAVLGEGPVWVEREQALYWVDIKAPAIFRRDEASGAVDRWTPPFRVGSLAPAAAGGFVGGAEKGLAWIDPVAGRYELFHDPEPELPHNRFNDGKTDRQGRFWAGTMDDREEAATGSLYRLDADMSVSRADAGYQVTNGPAFSPDGRTMYHSDSARQTIYAFDLDGAGGVSNKRVFAQFGDGDGYPDGMTVDAEGCLWVAVWDGWCIRRLSPAGERLQEVRMPVQRPTSCAFGGVALDRLYVTSARVGLAEKELTMQPLAGALFMIMPAAGGLPQTPFG